MISGALEAAALACKAGEKDCLTGHNVVRAVREVLQTALLCA